MKLKHPFFRVEAHDLITSTTAWWSFFVASCKAVWPLWRQYVRWSQAQLIVGQTALLTLFFMFNFAPFSSKISTQSMWLFPAAHMRGVSPLYHRYRCQVHVMTGTSSNWSHHQRLTLFFALISVFLLFRKTSTTSVWLAPADTWRAVSPSYDTVILWHILSNNGNIAMALSMSRRHLVLGVDVSSTLQQQLAHVHIVITSRPNKCRVAELNKECMNIMYAVWIQEQWDVWFTHFILLVHRRTTIDQLVHDFNSVIYRGAD